MNDFEPIDNKRKRKKTSSNKRINVNDKMELVLLIVFIALLILTIFLGIKAVSAKNEQKEHIIADIVIPVLGTDANNEISVDLSNMKKGAIKEYTFKISNSKNGKVNLEEVNYLLEFVENDNVDVEIFKNENTEAIVLDSDSKLKDNKLSAIEKQEDVYTLKIKALKKIKDKELLTIKIVS